MIKFFTTLILVCSLFLSISCGSPGSTNNTPDNTIPDVSTDVIPDATTDVIPDATTDVTTVSNYIGNMTFIINQNATVTQIPLNVIWKGTDEASAANIEDAKAACSSLSIDGREWRLPTIFEFISITDFSVFSVVGGIPQPTEVSLYLSRNDYWTASTRGSDQLIYDPNTGDVSTLATTVGNKNVRCVSGTAYNKDLIYPDSRWQRETLNSNTIIKDTITGLKWELDTSALITIGFSASAPTSCDGKTVAGLNSWRLPTVKELLSLFDLRKTVAPYIDNVFSGNERLLFSSDTSGFQIYGVDFIDGTEVTFRPLSANVKCVHD